MNLLKPFSTLLTRLRYPFSTPEEIGKDIGLNITNNLSFEEFIFCLTTPNMRPSKLVKHMSKSEAEKVFKTALRKEVFPHKSLFSYYFKDGWLEFLLDFDEQSKLRRLYISHRILKQKHEIPIE